MGEEINEGLETVSFPSHIFLFLEILSGTGLFSLEPDEKDCPGKKLIQNKQIRIYISNR